MKYILGQKFPFVLFENNDQRSCVPKNQESLLILKKQTLNSAEELLKNTSKQYFAVIKNIDAQTSVFLHTRPWILYS